MIDLEATERVLWGGWHLKMHDGDSRAAADLLLRYFQHPEVEQADESSAIRLRCFIAYGLLKAGDEAEALAQLWLLIDRPTRRRQALIQADIALRMFLHLQDREAMASEALTDTVQEVVHRLKRRKVRRWVPESKSYGELMQILNSAIPAKERERAIAEARSRQQREQAS